MLWGKTFFPFSECRQTGTSRVAGNLQATGLLDGPENVVGYVAPNCAMAHYGCAEGCDRQHRQRLSVTGPVGWIWVLRLMKGGACGLGGVGQGGFVSQPCCAKTTVALIKTWTTFHPLWCEFAATSAGCGSRTLLLPHFWSSFSEFLKSVFVAVNSRVNGEWAFSQDKCRTSTCGSLVTPCGHYQEDML